MTGNKGKNSEFDVLIVGAGPAGISAGIWCADLGLTFAVIEEGNVVGGQLLNIHNPIPNYPGVAAANGRKLRDRFAQSAENIGVSPILSTRIVQFEAQGCIAVDDTGNRYSAEFFVFATGVRRRKLGVPGEERFIGKGILSSGAGEKESVRGKTVAIVGGGDAALENALILSEFAERVYLVHRRPEFKGREMFVRQVNDHPRIEPIMNSKVNGIDGGESVSSIKISSDDGTTRSIEVDAVLIRVGVEPNSELLADKVRLDKNGYVVVDSTCRTNLPNVFAIGDLASPVSPTISTAAGMAATAVKTIRILSNNQKTL